MDPEIKKLVCDGCWQRFFSYEPFKVAWAAGPGLSYTTASWAEMQRSINFMCDWCETLAEETLFWYKHVTKTREEPPPEKTFNVMVCFVHRTATEGLRLKLTVENSWSCHFQVWTNPDDIAARHISERGVLDKLDTPEAYSAVLERIHCCESSHTRCPSPKPMTLPTRVIDCTDVDRPRLVQRSEDSPLAQYAALSYVWGEAQPNCTTTARLPSYLEGIDTRRIPKTIQDAIKVTSKLGLKYLWVDAFCIVQDSDEDKATEIAQIRNIFRHCYVTIIAANAAKVSDGFLNRILLYNCPGTLPFVCPEGSGTTGIMRLQSWTNAPREPINTRAWCFEERILSARALWYCAHTIQYECQTEHVNVDGGKNMEDPQDGVARLPDYMFTPDLGTDNALERHANGEDKSPEKLADDAWRNILSLYTRRKLTKPRDRLVALSGVVSYFSDFWGERSRYIAGLWEHDLPHSLLWYTSSPMPRPAKYRAPSWSWASVDGLINPANFWGAEALSTIRTCYAIPKHQRNPQAEVTDGLLVLEVALRPTTWDPIEQELLEIVHGIPVGVELEGRSERGEIAYVSPDAEDEVLRSPGIVYAAILAKYPDSLLGIVVVPDSLESKAVAKAQSGISIPAYRRVGWFTAPFCRREEWLRTPRQLIDLK
ncbi:hypothetical protein CEP54_015511 [Fusarium duplospermum]|uniref:Heterokaryon incompatibility domain-containing protein n=1 Tax=Fusarium duplospermum TaxID=1325734 RepID=A0A428NNH5_9HYPO|nr:hypothetical protein CEP54_015511 [Fusarium duplospermum]